MNKTLSTILIVLAIVALAGGIFFAGSMYARASAYGPAMMLGYGWNNNTNAYGPGMMGFGMMNGSNSYGYGPGMMGRAGYNNGYGPGGMMNLMGGGYGMMGSGMMSGYDWNNGTNSKVTTLTVDQARQAAEKYNQSLNITGLETGEVMIFDNNAYVIVEESDTGLGAFELLVDPVSQTAYPEYGPDMMWNLKYSGLNHNNMMGGLGGMMGGGMMRGWKYQNTTPAVVSAEMTVTPEQAIEYAQTYLDSSFAGAIAATDPTQFYGYYTLDFEKDGNVIGMLSVNGYNGQVFLHTWHNTFIEEAE